MSDNFVHLPASGSRYVIPAVDAEKQRLIKQYAMKKSFYGWNSAIPSTIDTARISNVLDIAAGTCVWTFDFADIPEVKSRLHPYSHDPKTLPIHLFACDIDSKFFPDKTIIDTLGITTFQQDVTKPFAPEMHGKFDLIHISFLVLCLTESDREILLKNCHQLLRPDGMVMMDEVDPILYPDIHSPPFEDSSGHDLATCMGGERWLHKANRIYTYFTLSTGCMIDLSFRLQTMLSTNGLTVVESQRASALCGRLCRVHRANDGRDLSEFEEFSVDNIVFILKHLAAALMEKGDLEAPEGNKITTESAMKALLQEVKEGLQEDGAVIPMRYWVAKKTGD